MFIFSYYYPVLVFSVLVFAVELLFGRFWFLLLVFAVEVLFRACTVCLPRIVVSICMFGYTCMFFGGVVDLLFTNVCFGCVISRVKEIAK